MFQVVALIAFAAMAAVSVLVYSKVGMKTSELIRNDHSSYLGELWRTTSSKENVLGSLALTGSVGQLSIRQHHADDSSAVKVYIRFLARDSVDT
jgi:hypothetical protein